MKAAQRLWEAWAGGTAALRRAKPGGATRLLQQSQPHVVPSTRAAVKPSTPTSFLRTVVSSVFEGAIPKVARSYKGHSSPARYGGTQGIKFAAAHLQRPTRFTPRSGATTSFARHPVGLSPARNFSTGQSAFTNVIHNAPFGVRVLADAGLWDARMLRKSEASRMKQAKGKGRLRDDGGSRQKPIDQAVMDTYFPRETSTESFSPAPEAVVRIVIPLHSSALAAFAEQSYETHRLLPRGFKGDLRNLEEAQKVHDGRIRKLVAALDMTDATVHFLPGNFVAIDLAAPWSVSEVRQALGIWGSDKLWFDIIDLKNLPSSSGSDISSLSDTDLDAHDVDSYFDTEEVAWYDDAARDLVMPSMLLGADSAETHPDLSQWSSEGKASPSPSVEARELRSFVDELDGMQRPGFAI